MYKETSVQSEDHKLKSPELRFEDQPMCLKFFYLIYCSSFGSLKVIISDLTTFVRSRDKSGTTWYAKRLNITNLSGMYEVRYDSINLF